MIKIPKLPQHKAIAVQKKRGGNGKNESKIVNSTHCNYPWNTATWYGYMCCHVCQNPKLSIPWYHLETLWVFLYHLNLKEGHFQRVDLALEQIMTTIPLVHKVNLDVTFHELFHYCETIGTQCAPLSPCIAVEWEWQRGIAVYQIQYHGLGYLPNNIIFIMAHMWVHWGQGGASVFQNELKKYMSSMG